MTNFDGCLELKEDGLVDEDLACLGAKVLDLILLELHGLAGAVASDWENGRAGSGDPKRRGAGGQLTF